MKRTFVILAAAAILATPATAAPPSAANGGGRGTWDGATPFSQFGFAVSIAADRSVTGYFNCLMAGASQFPGFTLMAVRGQVTSATIASNTATLEGAGMLQTGNLGKAPASFEVVVTEGGPGVGTLQLTLLTPFLFVLPTERVLEGAITIH